MIDSKKVATWASDDLCWFSFFSRLSGWRTVKFQLCGFYCKAGWDVGHDGVAISIPCGRTSRPATS